MTNRSLVWRISDRTQPTHAAAFPSPFLSAFEDIELLGQKIHKRGCHDDERCVTRSVWVHFLELRARRTAEVGPNKSQTQQTTPPLTAWLSQWMLK